MNELKIQCPICGVAPGSMCSPTGRVGKERYLSHVGRIVAAQLAEIKAKREAAHG